MKKKLNLSLDELRTLASKKNSYNPYSNARKTEILNAYLIDHLSITQLNKKYSVSRQAIYTWIHKFADDAILKSEFAATKNCTMGVVHFFR